jgi:hypothetical protein
VWAIVIYEANIAVGVPVADQVLAKDTYTLGGAVRLRDFLRHHHGMPIPTEVFSHGGTSIGLGEKVVIYFA